MTGRRRCPDCGEAQPLHYFGSADNGPCVDCRGPRRAPLPAPTPPIETPVPRRLVIRFGDFAAAVGTLTATQRQAFVGCVIEGLSLAEIARRTGVQPPAVSKALGRAIDTLIALGVLENKSDGNTRNALNHSCRVARAR